jgi:cAMP-binding proteins - catabolite gene activator and regulatory subunit of cAMP-dependent protein kinases
MADLATLVTRLGGTWFGSSLAPRDRERLVVGARLRPFGVGEILLREGAECDSFGVLLTGLLGMQVLVPGRGSVTLLTVEPGDVYGWSALVAPHRSTSTVLGIEPGEALVFDAGELRDLLRENDALAATLYPRILQVLGRRLTATRFQLLDLYARERDYVPW